LVHKSRKRCCHGVSAGASEQPDALGVVEQYISATQPKYIHICDCICDEVAPITAKYFSHQYTPENFAPFNAARLPTSNKFVNRIREMSSIIRKTSAIAEIYQTQFQAPGKIARNSLGPTTNRTSPQSGGE
jgi:hypothetical protein